MVSERTFRVLDPDYPPVLRELRAPPDPVCVRGQLLGGPSVAIVGTRDATAEALWFSHALASRLARRGVTVWSGGALGIDAAAHRGALDAGGVTVAVVPTGLDHCYPVEHRALYDEIVEKGGALVSPFEPSHRAMQHTFHQRNGVLAALTNATVVVQAPLISGARSTANAARKLNRPLFVMPSWPWEPKGKGNLLELSRKGTRLFDEVDLCRQLGVEEGGLVRELERAIAREIASASASASAGQGAGAGARGGEGAGARAGEIDLSGLSDAAREVFFATSTTPRHADDLCLKSALPVALVREALLTLTLHAVLVEGPCGWFRRLS
jgi:DNA processing protein